MVAPSIATFRKYSAPRYAPESYLVGALDGIVSVRMGLQEDGLHGCTIVADAEAAWIADLRAREVILIDVPGKGEFEWLVSGTEEAVGPTSAPVVSVTCDPLIVLLGDLGVIEDSTVGGASYMNLGFVGLPVRTALATFLLPTLVRWGVDWIELGDIEPTDRITRSWEGLTPHALLEAVREETGAKYRLRHDPGNSRYLIDVKYQLGAELEVAYLREGHEIVDVSRSRNREELFTAMRPVGSQSPGALEKATIGLGLWRVSAKDGDELTLEPEGGGDGPILEGGQFAPIYSDPPSPLSPVLLYPGAYLEAPDGSFVEIVSSTAPDVVELDDATAFSVDDLVRFVADDSGTLITEVPSPSGIQAFGRVQGRLEFPFREEIHLLRNPTFSEWDSKPEGVTCRADGTQSTVTSLNVKDVPGSAPTFEDGDVVTVNDNQVTALNATPSFSGGAGTLSLRNAVSVGNEGPVRIIKLEGREPAHVTRNEYPVMLHGTYQATGLSCDLKGDHFLGATGLRKMTVDGLTEGDVILPGDIFYDGPTIRTWATYGAVADSNGEAEVDIFSLINLSNNTAFTVVRAFPSRPYGETDILFGLSGLSAGGSPDYIAFPFSLSAPEGFTALFARLHYGLFAAQLAETYGAGGEAKPKLELWRTSGTPTELAEAIPDDFALTVTVPTYLQFDIQYTVTARDPQDYELRFYPQGQRANTWHVIAAIFQASLHIGYDAEAPLRVGWEPVRGHQVGNRELLVRAQWGATYKTRAIRFASVLEVGPDHPALEVGGTVLLRARRIADSLLLVVVSEEFDPQDPEDRVLTLGTDAKYLSAIAAEEPRRKYWVDLELPDVDISEVLETLEQPPNVPGSLRAVLLPSEDPPAGDDPLPINPL